MLQKSAVFWCGSLFSTMNQETLWIWGWCGWVQGISFELQQQQIFCRSTSSIFRNYNQHRLYSSTQELVNGRTLSLAEDGGTLIVSNWLSL